MKPKFALVQWIGGDYDKTYTAGVPVDWILDFDINTFNPEKETEDHYYNIEWRKSNSGKIPKCGWKFYDAKVIRVSHRIESLEKQIQILDGITSPWAPAAAEMKSGQPDGKKLDSAFDTIEKETEIAPISTSTPKKKNKTKKRKEKRDKNEMETDHGDESQKKKKKKEKPSEQESSNKQIEDGSIRQYLNTSSDLGGSPAATNRGFVYKLNDFIQADGEVPSTSTPENIKNTRNQLETGHNKMAEAGHGDKGRKLKGKSKKSSDRESSERDIEIDNIPNPLATPSNLEDQSLKQILLNLCQDIKLVKQVQLDMLNNQNQPAQQQHPPAGQIEIGHLGSDVFVTQRQWDTANAQSSYTSMGVSLIRALFDDDVLMASNLKGGTSKINKNAPRRPGLNPVIIAAIEEAVRNKFPDFKRGHFGAQINNMMNDFRRKNKAAANDNEEPED